MFARGVIFFLGTVFCLLLRIQFEKVHFFVVAKDPVYTATFGGGGGGAGYPVCIVGP